MLQSAKVKLRPMETSDIPLLDALRKSGDVLSNLSTWLPISDSLASQEAYFGEMLKKGRTGEIQFVITTVDDTVIGATGLVMIDFRNAYAMVHIFVGAEYTGRGYGTDAMKLLVNFLFMEMNLERVALNVFAFNERAIASYKKAGYVEEGRLRQHLYRNGKYHDVVQMAILKEDFLKNR